jgi:hypothetical protein
MVHCAANLYWVPIFHARLCCAATVQDFLQRYEVGETVGVGGTRAVPAAHGAQRFKARNSSQVTQ